MAVPFIDLQRWEPGFLEAWDARAAAIARQTAFVGGPAVTALEARLSGAVGLPHAIACANGTDAIQIALRAAGVGPGDLVLIPDLTFWATFEAVANVGARVHTVDVDPDDLQIDVDLVARAIAAHRPKAVITVHLYGWASARLDGLRALCRDAGVVLIEDAAQAFGVLWQGRPVLEGALLATTSFYPAKVLGACGDAGAVFAADAALADRARMLANHGRSAHYGHAAIGWNSRMGGFEAAWLDLALDHLGPRLDQRRAACAAYRERLAGLDGLRVVAPPEGVRENGYLNVCLIAEPDRKAALEARLRAAGIGFGNVYPAPMSAQPGAADWLAGRTGGQVAADTAARVLNLPVFPGITEAEIAEVVAAVRRA